MRMTQRKEQKQVQGQTAEQITGESFKNKPRTKAGGVQVINKSEDESDNSEEA